MINVVNEAGDRLLSVKAPFRVKLSMVSMGTNTYHYNSGKTLYVDPKALLLVDDLGRNKTLTTSADAETPWHSLLNEFDTIMKHFSGVEHDKPDDSSVMVDQLLSQVGLN